MIRRDGQAQRGQTWVKLYERDLSPADAPNDWHKQDKPQPAADLVDGRMLLTPQGKARAGLLAKKVPELSDLCFASVDFRHQILRPAS
jgi:hypothetical protein